MIGNDEGGLLSVSGQRATRDIDPLPPLNVQTTMSAINRVIDVIIARIEQIADYIIFEKHITLSEGSVFMLSLWRAIWYSVFGVQLGNMQGSVLSDAWIFAFAGVTIVHFISFFLGLWARIIAVIFQAFLWCFLALLVALHDISMPTVPAFFIWSTMAVFIAIRLMREYRQQAV